MPERLEIPSAMSMRVPVGVSCVPGVPSLACARVRPSNLTCCCDGRDTELLQLVKDKLGVVEPSDALQLVDENGDWLCAH